MRGVFVKWGADLITAILVILEGIALRDHSYASIEIRWATGSPIAQYWQEEKW